MGDVVEFVILVGRIQTVGVLEEKLHGSFKFCMLEGDLQKVGSKSESCDGEGGLLGQGVAGWHRANGIIGR